MDYEEYKRKALEPIVNYIESVMASYSKEELEARIKKALPEKVSEDEKIRQALFRCCDDWEKGQFGCMAKEDVPAIRAYLEKQKERVPENEEMGTREEQKPADKLALENPLTGEKVYEREIPEWMMDCDPKDAEAIIHLAAKGWAVIAPRKEQKPLSTEETELNSIAFLEQLGHTCIPPGAEQKPAAFSCGHENGTEWSEEDKRLLRTALFNNHNKKEK